MMLDDTHDAQAADEADATSPDVMERARADYSAAIERERSNLEEGYRDLEFLAGDQWDQADRDIRKDRPCLTENRLPQFVRQITGDIRQMRPSIKVVPVDDRGDPQTAEVIEGLIRYIENRSDASTVYFSGADSQVQAGIGHWRVVTEYASDTTLEQEIAVRPVDDGLSVLWDPDAIQLSREDAEFCFVPVDMSKRAFERRYPGKSATGFGDEIQRSFGAEWFGEDYVRVAEYFYREPVTRTLLILDGETMDLTDKPDEIAGAAEFVQMAMAEGREARVETRDASQIMRAVISGAEVLEESKAWPGRFIPIIPVIGEEIRIGRKVVRFGVVRNARDTMRRFNYFISAQAETIALQPKAPFIGTEKQFENYEDEWERANTDNLPYLRYTWDANAPGPPQRVQPPVASSGIAEAIGLAETGLQATTGIYNASLGAKSNETSGKAINARDRQGDTGSYVHVEHFGKAVAHTGRVIADLIPHVYDTARTMRIVGADGKEKLVPINQPAGLAEQADPESEAVGRVLHDVTIGAYDVVMEMGPGYATRREEARDGMTAFLQAAPNAAPVVLDLIAKAQDWPNADEIAERLEAVAPPQIKALLAAKRGEPPAAPPPPNPQEQAALAQQQRQQELDERRHQLDLAKLQVEQQKLQAELAKAGAEVQKAQIEAETRVHEARAGAAAANASGQDPRVDHVIAAVQQLAQMMDQISAALAGPPQPEPPPDLGPQLDMSAPSEPGPPGFFMPAPDPAGAPVLAPVG